MRRIEPSTPLLIKVTSRIKVNPGKNGGRGGPVEDTTDYTIPFAGKQRGRSLEGKVTKDYSRPSNTIVPGMRGSGVITLQIFEPHGRRGRPSP
jgi:hypothetical protein